MVEGYILNVGCGNMIAIKFPNGKKMMVDCNLLEDYSDDIISFLIRKNFDKIDVFINTHRDIDHLRGIKDLNKKIPIYEIWDNGVSGSTDATDYKEYMALRRTVSYKVIKPRTYDDQFCENTVLRYINGNYDDVNYEINDTSIVFKVEYFNNSILLTGDTSFRPWKEKIIPCYSESKLRSNLLVAPHHGSLTFFDDPSDDENYYIEHINIINPQMTIISVGENQWDLPDEKAVKLYKEYTKGSNNGTKIYRTDEVGNIYFQLKVNGWILTKNVQ